MRVGAKKAISMTRRCRVGRKVETTVLTLSPTHNLKTGGDDDPERSPRRANQEGVKTSAEENDNLKMWENQKEQGKHVMKKNVVV